MGHGGPLLIPSVYQTTITATTDVVGGATFKIPAPAASNMVARYTIACPEASAGARWLATVSAGPRWGPWFGPQPFGPITYDAGLDATVAASGLHPLTTYTIELLGLLIDARSALVDMPLPTGATALTGSDVITPNLAVLTLTAGVTAIPPVPGAFPTAGWNAVRVAANSATHPVSITLDWIALPTGFLVGRRSFILGNANPPGVGGGLFVSVPVQGDQLQATLVTNTVPTAINFHLELTSLPAAAWGGPDTYGAAAITVAANGGTAEVDAIDIFGGPATLDLNMIGMPAWTAQVQTQDVTGAWSPLLTRSNIDGGPHQVVPFVVPAAPVRVIITNNSAAAGTADVWLTYDLSRVG